MQKGNGRGPASQLARAGDPGNGSKPPVTGIEPFAPARSSAAFIDDELRKYNEKLMDDIRKALNPSNGKAVISMDPKTSMYSYD